MKKIVGTFTKQVWVGPKRDQAMTVGEVKFDATRAVLSLGIEDIRFLKDNDFSSDEIGRTCVEWDCPFEVCLVESVVEFFGLDQTESPEIALEALTREQLDAARAEFGPLEPNNATLDLSLKVAYALNGEAIQTVRENLERMVRNAIGDGMLTGSTAAEVEEYKLEIHARRVAETINET